MEVLRRKTQIYRFHNTSPSRKRWRYSLSCKRLQIATSTGRFGTSMSDRRILGL